MGNDITPIVWRDTIVLASDRPGGRGGYDLYSFPLCGPVVLALRVVSPSAQGQPSVRITVGDDHTGERELTISPGTELRLPFPAFRRIHLRAKAPCSGQRDTAVLTPCDISYSVLYRLILLVPDSFPTFSAVLPAAQQTDYQPLTAEHAWAQALQTSLQLRSTPLTSPRSAPWLAPEVRQTEQLLDSLAQYLRWLAESGCLSPRGIRIQIIGTAEPEASLHYNGPPVMIDTLKLLPGTVLSAPQLALLRAHAVAAELQRRLPPLPRLSWQILAEVGSPAGLARVRIEPDGD
jgi:hypothetical protein